MYNDSSSQATHQPSDVFPVPRQRRTGGILQLVRSFKPRDHPKIVGVAFLWLLGLFAVCICPSFPSSVPPSPALRPHPLSTTQVYLRTSELPLQFTNTIFHGGDERVYLWLAFVSRNTYPLLRLVL